jgi:hypothetical protein
MLTACGNHIDSHDKDMIKQAMQNDLQSKLNYGNISQKISATLSDFTFNLGPVTKTYDGYTIYNYNGTYIKRQVALRDFHLTDGALVRKGDKSDVRMIYYCEITENAAGVKNITGYKTSYSGK